VRKFVYVSILDGPRLTHLDIVKAHEDFVDALAASGMESTVLRPTDFFSDLAEIFAMARKGRVYLFGDGRCRVSPIHGADLAAACADALDDDRRSIDVGGPDTLSWRDVAALAFRVQGKPVRITTVPRWIMSAVVSLTRMFSRHRAELMAFFTAMGTRDVVGPTTGTRSLEAHFRALEATR